MQLSTFRGSIVKQKLCSESKNGKLETDSQRTEVTHFLFFHFQLFFEYFTHQLRTQPVLPTFPTV